MKTTLMTAPEFWHYNVTFTKRTKSGRWIEPTVALVASSPDAAISAICAAHGIQRRSVSSVVRIAPASIPRVALVKAVSP